MLLWLCALAWGGPPATQRVLPTWALRGGGCGQWGVVPEFQAASRDRLAAQGSVVWAPEGPVRLSLSGDYLRDAFAGGRVQSGWGDLRLGTDARLWRGPVDLRLGWEVKLPNASDEIGLGTDETDSTVIFAVVAPLGRAHLAATGGLGILGNPLQFANQDDVPLGWLSGSLPLGPTLWRAQVGGAFRTSRNPARRSAAVSVEGGCPWLSGVGAQVGLTPAAPDVGGRAWVGWGWGCPGD